MRHTDNFVYNGVGVTSGLLLACCLGLSGCQNDSAHKMAREQHYDYTSAFAKCIPLELHDQTLAEHEHDCARQYYEAKKDEMNTLFAQVSAAYEERVKENPTEMNKAQLDKLMTSQQQFTKFSEEKCEAIKCSIHQGLSVPLLWDDDGLYQSPGEASEQFEEGVTE